MTEQDVSEGDLGKRVLLLEDDDIQGRWYQKFLTIRGYHPDLATNIEEAAGLEQAALETGKPYYAAILDMCVPHKRGGPKLTGAGLRYAKELRGKNPEIKIALYTYSQFERNDIERLRAEGIVYISKDEGNERFIEFLQG